MFSDFGDSYCICRVCFCVSYEPVLRPDPKRFCNMGLVALVEEGLSDVLLVQLQPEDGVDGPGHGGAAVPHHRAVDGQVLAYCRICHRILKRKGQEHGICLWTNCIVYNRFQICILSSKSLFFPVLFLFQVCSQCIGDGSQCHCKNTKWEKLVFRS